MRNYYQDIVRANIPRLLTLYNYDACAPTCGYGDRSYWGWKVSDYANGTMQGGVHALSIALKLGIVEHERFVLSLIDNVVLAIDSIRDRNGSLVEAYPRENSFCVTALVAFDVLSAIQNLAGRIDDRRQKRYLETVRPLIEFIIKNDEEHAVISNHIATAAAACALWNSLSGDTSTRYQRLLQVIYAHQSEEGWYREYEGADPGYQTLCTYYLASVYQTTRDEELLQSLKRSAEFLKFFIHPDHTIGGLYGSRNTEVYYPAGLVMLADRSEDFAVAAKYLGEGVVGGVHISPENIDAGNFIPLLNAYAVAAMHYDARARNIANCAAAAPCQGTFARDFPHAGVYIKSTTKYYAIINYRKGGSLKVFDQEQKRIDIEDGGIFARLSDGTTCSTQQYDETISFKDGKIQASFYRINESSPGPFQFALLRVLSLTMFRSVLLGNVFKKLVVRMLMTGKNRVDGSVTRHFMFQEDRIIIRETVREPKICTKIGHFGKCRAIHMASSGYYSKQLEQTPEKPQRVEFL